MVRKQEIDFFQLFSPFCNISINLFFVFSLVVTGPFLTFLKLHIVSLNGCVNILTLHVKF